MTTQTATRRHTLELLFLVASIGCCSAVDASAQVNVSGSQAPEQGDAAAVIDRSAEPMPSYIEPLESLGSDAADADEPRPSSGRGARIAGYVLSIVGIAGVGFGVACASIPADDYDESPCLSGIVYSGVTLVVGVVLLYFGYKQKAIRSQWEFDHRHRGQSGKTSPMSIPLTYAF